MVHDQLTLPLADDDLITLAEHHCAMAAREDASQDDYVRLCDIFPAVLQRLRDKVEITRDLVEIPEIWLSDAPIVGRQGSDRS